MHAPGLRLAMPATVSDAYHLLQQSLAQPDPVIFIEHKALYATSGELMTRPRSAMGQGACSALGQ